MKALVFHGKLDVRVENVPAPRILNPRDAIVEITRTAICGSDLHLYHGMLPALKSGDILGHEFMGVVVEVGDGVEKLKKGDRCIKIVLDPKMASQKVPEPAEATAVPGL